MPPTYAWIPITESHFKTGTIQTRCSGQNNYPATVSPPVNWWQLLLWVSNTNELSVQVVYVNVSFWALKSSSCSTSLNILTLPWYVYSFCGVLMFPSNYHHSFESLSRLFVGLTYPASEVGTEEEPPLERMNFYVDSDNVTPLPKILHGLLMSSGQMCPA